ncbi:MAG TPA: hypothetical protein VM409_07710 [Chloroflexia bacterium]|nr:hypothetical protein [Chloroflexia bacterium]
MNTLRLDASDDERGPGGEASGRKPGDTYASEGALTLAVLFGLAGVLLGWIMAATPREIPGQGTLVGGDILSTTFVAGLLAAAIGAVIGALWGLTIPRRSMVADEPRPHEERLVPLSFVSAHVPLTEESRPPHGMNAVSVQSEIEEYDVEEELPSANVSGLADPQEAEMRNSEGQDPGNVTGTEGSIDPETGSYGTAGTPMTTGYGVSGSTVGTGSSQVEREHEQRDFKGTTPDSGAYDRGGRGSTDTDEAQVPDSSATPVTQKYGEGTTSDEAPAQSEPTTQDVYEAGPSYGSDARAGRGGYIASAETSQYSGSGVDQPPSYGQVEVESTEASAGTNIPGTSDPRGLGDNTDDTETRHPDGSRR